MGPLAHARGSEKRGVPIPSHDRKGVVLDAKQADGIFVARPKLRGICHVREAKLAQVIPAANVRMESILPGAKADTGG
jgi:hypothetical protein